MIHLYTGDGKGKTTAAAGLAVRAAGAGLHVVFSQFMKGNDTGELHILRDISRITIVRSEKAFGFYHTLTDEEKRELTGVHDRILDRILEAVQKETCDMVILDEITYPVNWGLISEEKLKYLLDRAGASAKRPVELVMTGREPADFLMECADYVTQMRMVRHPYERGIPARRGIEF